MFVLVALLLPLVSALPTNYLHNISLTYDGSHLTNLDSINNLTDVDPAMANSLKTAIQSALPDYLAHLNGSNATTTMSPEVAAFFNRSNLTNFLVEVNTLVPGQATPAAAPGIDSATVSPSQNGSSATPASDMGAPTNPTLAVVQPLGGLITTPSGAGTNASELEFPTLHTTLTIVDVSLSFTTPSNVLNGSDSSTTVSSVNVSTDLPDVTSSTMSIIETTTASSVTTTGSTIIATAAGVNFNATEATTSAGSTTLASTILGGTLGGGTVMASSTTIGSFESTTSPSNGGSTAFGTTLASGSSSTVSVSEVQEGTTAGTTAGTTTSSVTTM